MKNKIFPVIFLLFGAAALFSCVKEEEPALPYIKVDFTVNLLIDSGLKVGTPLVHPYVGYQGNGVIIVPKGYGDEAEFKAYDATCTRNISEETTAVELDKNNATATCPKCKTVYNLLNGYAINQNFHLQEYAVRRIVTDRLHITTY